MTMRIAVTGAAGFVGSQVVRTLLDGGLSVLAIDDLSTGRRENLDGLACDWAAGDAGSAAYAGSDAVVHCAAAPDIQGNWRTEEARDVQWERNANLTRRVLDRTPHAAIFVNISTCSVYAGGEVTEHTIPRATSPYAASKLAAEALVQAYTEARRVRGHTLRLCNVVGPRYSHGHLADFVRMAREGHLHALDDGRKRKAFVHVADVAFEVMMLCVGMANRRAPLANVVSPTLWSWRDSVAVMTAMRPEAKFRLTHEAQASGWIGDPATLVVTSEVLDHRQRRSVVDGVREALDGLGW